PAAAGKAGRPAGTPAAVKARPADPAPPASKETTISGRVLDPAGKPVPGAPVYLVGWKNDRTASKPQRVATTDAAGRFSCDLSVAKRFASVELVASARGLASDWVQGSEAGTGLTLRLARDLRIRGRLLDLEGKPVAGAVVKVLAISTFADGDL